MNIYLTSPRSMSCLSDTSYVQELREKVQTKDSAVVELKLTAGQLTPKLSQHDTDLVDGKIRLVDLCLGTCCVFWDTEQPLELVRILYNQVGGPLSGYMFYFLGY